MRVLSICQMYDQPYSEFTTARIIFDIMNCQNIRLPEYTDYY